MTTRDWKHQNLELKNRLYSSARTMVPLIRQRANETAELGKLPDATIAEMQEAGFFRIMQPARYGGYELEPHVFFEVQMILAEGCMSTAWVLGVVAIHNWQLGLFDDKAQQDVWQDNDATLISSSYMPVGKVTHTEGGYMLSGKWGFSSGSKHCDWAFLGAMVPPAEEGGAPDYCTFLVPRADYQIVDNWNVSGLEGTGSNDIVVDNVFVPAHRLHRSLDGYNCDNPGNSVNLNPVFRLPFGQIFPRAVSTSSIGALQGALTAFITVNKNRTGLNDGARAALDPQALYAAATAEAVIDECRTVLFRNFDRQMDAVNGAEPLTTEERVKMRFDASAVSKKCTDAMNELFLSCGAQGIFKDHPINRSWLDINAGRTHVANNAFKLGRNLGSLQFGFDNTDFFL
ncbi:Flavin-dependent monooxygenase, oxygenase subunit HsaA [Sinobacterium norvegicum]|uniref:Flavin-dependent monooxygenase, oxygenase subunit HsaA n=1 Tax=Sinobacterium norvegicum TaxID=1641715 RepID=A0ABM9AGK1_9GAMM|nr:acyl-CoA dehydrogenase family protein [Sinobacterium norvegicum]CAH0992340.1 Flavin-dependent monooxygenase, oxygenase subunit HsaA [Sinobacterium norvegicum]